MKNKATLHLPNARLAAIWKNEILGQLSDGMWENTKPDNHYKFWFDCEVVVDGKYGIEGHVPYSQKRNYGLTRLFTDKELECIPLRTRGYVVWTQLFGEVDKHSTAIDYLVTVDSYDAYLESLNNIIARNNQFECTVKYFTEKRDSITKEQAEKFFAAFPSYTKKQLMEDTRELKKAIETNFAG